jgi:hypothetical protein
VDHALGAGDHAGRVDGAPRHVGRPLDLGQQSAHVDRVAVGRRVATFQARLRPLAEHGGRRHVASRVAEDAVVQQQRGDVLPAGRGVQHLVQALADHVTVTLKGDHRRVGDHALDPRGDRRRPAVQALERVEIADLHHLRVAAVPGDEDGAA